jgi:hypothetical protein
LLRPSGRIFFGNSDKPMDLLQHHKIKNLLMIKARPFSILLTCADENGAYILDEAVIRFRGAADRV